MSTVEHKVSFLECLWIVNIVSGGFGKLGPFRPLTSPPGLITWTYISLKGAHLKCIWDGPQRLLPPHFIGCSTGKSKFILLSFFSNDGVTLNLNLESGNSRSLKWWEKLSGKCTQASTLYLHTAKHHLSILPWMNSLPRIAWVFFIFAGLWEMIPFNYSCKSFCLLPNCPISNHKI